MKDITLANGETIDININWLTLKLLSEYGLDKLNEKIKNDNERLEAAAVLIHAILRSNGKNVTQNEALSLISIEDDTIFTVFEIFKDKLEIFKKKQESHKHLEKVTK